MTTPHTMEQLIKAVTGRPGWSVTYSHDDPSGTQRAIIEPMVEYAGVIGHGDLKVVNDQVDGHAYLSAHIGGSAGAPRRVTLPPYVTWMERTLGSPVGWPDEAFREVHLVYASGQWVDREPAAAR